MNVEELLEFIEVYDVQAVKDVTKNVLTTGNVTAENAVHLIQISTKINDDTIKNRVFQFILDNMIRVSSIPDWQLVSGTVGDELQEFTIGWIRIKVAKVEVAAITTARQMQMKCRANCGSSDYHQRGCPFYH